MFTKKRDDCTRWEIATETLDPGTPILFDDGLVGVVPGWSQIQIGDKVAIQLEGIFQVNSESGVTFSQGAKVYWDQIAETAVASASDTTYYVGVAEEAKASADTYVMVRLNALTLADVEAKAVPLVKVVTIDETSGAGTYTKSVDIPAGFTTLEVSMNPVSAWDNAGTATGKAGDGADDDGHITGANLKTATDKIVGTGAYGKAPKAYPSGGTITFSVTTSSTGGGAGLTTGLVWMVPSTDVSAATKA